MRMHFLKQIIGCELQRASICSKTQKLNTKSFLLSLGTQSFTLIPSLFQNSFSSVSNPPKHDPQKITTPTSIPNENTSEKPSFTNKYNQQVELLSIFEIMELSVLQSSFNGKVNIGQSNKGIWLRETNSHSKRNCEKSLER